MNKKFVFPISVILIIFILSFNFAFARSFDDVTTDNKYYLNAIDFLSEISVISGYDDNTFKPNNNITRAEVVKMIVTAFELTDNGAEVKKFDDTVGTWSEPFVNVAVQNGIVSGYTDGTFKPNNQITYGEICTIISNLLHLKVSENEGQAYWADKYVDAVQNANLFYGYDTDEITAKNPAIRINVALLICNSLDYKGRVISPVVDPVVEPVEDPATEPVNEPAQEPNETEENPVTDLSVFDTKKIYSAVVRLEKQYRGIDYVIVETFEGEEITLEVKKLDKKPKYGSLIFFKVDAKGRVSLKLEVKSSTIKTDDMLYVDEAEGDIVVIRDQETIDVSLKECEIDGKTIRLDRLDYFEVGVTGDKDDAEFTSCEQVERNQVGVTRGDRLIIDEDKGFFLIVRGLEELDEPDGE